jgi:hypothetical protein
MRGLHPPPGGLRPIACGDVFRRTAAKLLCAAVADDARAHLKECGQLGVCVPGGMDAISHAARRYAQDFLQSGSDRVIFKADFRNAFTCCASEFLQAVVARMAEGRVDESARRFMYGARLVALLKTDGGLRPIACGDVFRRMAAKLLCAAVADDARAHLKECGQLGVCVPGGMDAISHAARTA